MFPWNLFPFGRDAMKMMQQMQPEEIEKHIMDIMEKVFSNGTMPSSELFSKMNNSFYGKQTSNSLESSNLLESDIFETHDYIYVMIPVKEPSWIKRMKLFHTSNQLIIKHVPTDKDKHVVTLPATVNIKGTTAHLKDNLLEVKLTKNTDFHYSEIGIKEFP